MKNGSMIVSRSKKNHNNSMIVSTPVDDDLL